jgi:hypothetical protein
MLFPIEVLLATDWNLNGENRQKNTGQMQGDEKTGFGLSS